jgi:FKBP-type peptidyl-prolyl cis-trans isomerase
VPELQTNEDGVPTTFAVTGDPPAEPTELGVYPVISGTGPTVGEGDLLTVHYLGQIFPDGEIFDESWTEAEPVAFQIGAGALISGWDQGLVGQRVGSRIVLVIPPDLAYGEEGSPPTIPGGASLIFSVDILGIG